MSYTALFSFTASVIGVLLIAIILYRHKHPSARFLAFFLFTLASSNFFFFLVQSGYFTRVPFLFRVGALLNYLTAPSMLFYILFALNKRERLHWRDALNLVPALIFFIDYLPIYLSSNAAKKQIIESLLDNVYQAQLCKEGWLLPPGTHYIMRHLIALGYVCYAAFVLYKAYRSDLGKQPINRYLLNWFKVVVGLIFLLSIIGVITYVFSYSQFAWSVVIWEPLIIFTALGLTLFFKPEILYGTYTIKPPEIDDNKHKSLVLSADTMQKVQAQLGGFIEERKFLRKNIRLKEVAEELEIQPYILSAYVNQVYGLRFNDLINQNRIQHMLNDGFFDGQDSMLTLEAIAEKAGFSNRTTFLNAFKKVTGMTPSAFLQQHKSKAPSGNGHPGKDGTG